MALSYLPVSPESELPREVSVTMGAQSLSRDQNLGFSDIHTQQSHVPNKRHGITTTSSLYPGKVKAKVRET